MLLGLIIGLLFGIIPAMVFGALASGFRRLWDGDLEAGTSVGLVVGIITYVIIVIFFSIIE